MIFAGGRYIPVTTKFGIGVNFKTIVNFWIQSDYLSPCGLEILNQVDYCVSVCHSWILVEVSALMHHVGGVSYGDILQEVELSHHRRDLPVLRYHKTMVIYPYPFLVVITLLFSCIIFINDCICILTVSPE